MSKLEVRKSKFRSSQAERDAARAEYERLKARKAEIEAEMKAMGNVLNPFVEAAQFVCDVNGDPPSINTLRTSLERYKHYIALTDELRDVVDRRDKASLESRRYQWTAGKIGTLCFVVRGEGDTRQEALERAKGKEP
jgi:hypothetical protein